VHRIVEVKPLENYRLWLRFSDGVEGLGTGNKPPESGQDRTLKIEMR